MKNARILIAGCGDIGSELGLRLAGEGHEVWGLRRSPQSLPAAIRPLAADLADPATLRGLPAADYVFYTAAAGRRQSEDAYRRTYVEGLGNLLDALERTGEAPRRVFFTSSTAVYAQDGGEWVDETSATAPVRWNGSVMLEAERRLDDAPFASTVVRLGGIYGPGRERLIRLVRSGAAVLPREPSYTNRIHRDDCARALAHLLDLDLAGRPPAALYVGVDSEPADLGDVLVWLAERLGVPRPPVSGEARGKNKRCRNERLLATGFRLRYPSFRDGYAAVLRGVGT